ncbi:MAG: alkaline phosphatase [Isosphaeraceae bacterium]
MIEPRTPEGQSGIRTGSGGALLRPPRAWGIIARSETCPNAPDRPSNGDLLVLVRLFRPFLAASLFLVLTTAANAADRIKEMQNDYVARKAEKVDRAYHFGSQGPGNIFSNHASHSNRLIPVYAFGRKVDLSSVTGKNSRYRDAEKIRELYGVLPENTLNPDADYADQSDLYRVQKEAVARGAKYMFTVWFDGMDWHSTRAAAIVKTGKVYNEGKGSGLNFQDYKADDSAQYGFVVTSPTRASAKTNVDTQTVSIPKDIPGGGYDAQIAGPNPWAEGPLKAPGYLKGQSGNEADKAGVEAVGRVRHAYTDSSQSAAEYASGVKSYNASVNVTDDGRFVPTLFHQLQEKGWKVGTATSVPFDHVSPAAMYAHNVHRDDYQDLGRDMLGLPGITRETGKDDLHPGLDVVMGTGYNRTVPDSGMKGQGKNAAKGQNMYIADADLKAINVKHGGKYVVATTRAKVNGAYSLHEAAEEAARDGHRLFAFYGTNVYHLPFQTADGNFDPANDLNGKAESYTKDDLNENPTLADMTRAALKVLSAKPGHPFALFVEAGDVDSGLHANNLDNAIGAIYSGEAAVQAIIDWVEKNSNWDESALIVTADHGHYLVIDDAEELAGSKSKGQ